MTDKYVSPTGNDTTGDGTEGNPYLTIDKGFDVLTGTGNDNVYLADGDYNQTTNLLNNGGNKGSGSITLQSSSGDASLCSISGNATEGNYYLLRAAEASIPMDAKNITFKDHKRTDGLSVFLNSSGANFSFTDCIWDNLTIVGTAATNTGIYRITTLTDFTVNGLTVRNCVWNGNATAFGAGANEGALWSSQNWGGVGSFSNITVESLTITYTSGYQFNGILFYRGPNAWSGVNSFSGITITGENFSHALIKLESTTGFSHTIDGTFSVSGLTTTLTGASGGNYGLINVSNNDTLTISAAMTFDSCVTTQATSVIDYGCVASISATSNIVFTTDASLIASNNNMPKASGIVYNGGNDMTVRGVTAYSNTLRAGVIHISSLGSDTDISGCYMHDNTTENGGAIYSYPPSGVNNITINNVIAIDNTASTTGDGMLLNALAATTANYTLNNVFCRNGGTDEINCAGTGDPVVTADYSNIEGGVGATTGIDTYGANNIDSADTLVDGVPVAGSASIGAGVKWWTGSNPVGANGEPFADFANDIGGNMSTHNPFHPVNL